MPEPVTALQRHLQEIYLQVASPLKNLNIKGGTLKKYIFVSLATLLILGQQMNIAQAVKIKKFKNCTELNRVYPHGVAKKGYKKTASGYTDKPFVNNKLYKANQGSDRDKDGVACER